MKIGYHERTYFSLATERTLLANGVGLDVTPTGMESNRASKAGRKGGIVERRFKRCDETKWV